MQISKKKSGREKPSGREMLHKRKCGSLKDRVGHSGFEQKQHGDTVRLHLGPMESAALYDLGCL